MNRPILFFIVCFFAILSTDTFVFAQIEPAITSHQYHNHIYQLWNKNKLKYAETVKKSRENPKALYNIQNETNNLLKYAGYCQQYALLDELCSLYLLALDTLTTTDQYLYDYYPGSPKNSVHQLKRKYRMWVDKQTPIGHEAILDSSQFLYLLSDTVCIIADVEKEKRTPTMSEALNKFIPLLLEHYGRWIYDTPGPFQVLGWGCRYNGEYVPPGMNHFDFLNKKLNYELGNGKSPAYCNSVRDLDMWIIAGVANILAVYKKENDIVPITPEAYKRLLNYVKMGSKLIDSRFIYTKLNNFEGKQVIGALFQPGTGDEHPERAFVGYNGQDFPQTAPKDKSKYRRNGVGWDLSHARRFVHVFETLLKSKDILGLDFPTKDLMVKMGNQLVFATFNRDFKKPLFTNFMDGTNGWFRVGYSGRMGFGYGPWDMSVSVLTGGYGFWSRYNSDTQKVFTALIDMLKSKDPEIRKHVIEHYETTHWNKFRRTPSSNFTKLDDPNTQSVLIQFLPSLCFMVE